MYRILVVDDDGDFNSTVCSFLTENGYEAKGYLNASDAYDAMYGGAIFDMIISDIIMPGVSGFEFAQAIRKQDREIPILFITVRSDFPSKQKGYQIGIDDYMVKPINLDEMLLHIEALLRRANVYNSHELKIGTLRLDADEHAAYVGDNKIDLTVREFNLIYRLLSFPKKTFTRSQLMAEFWEDDKAGGLRTVDVYITKLRNKFADCDEFKIVTVHGMGYKAVLKGDEPGGQKL